VDDIEVLTGGNATRAAIEDAIANAVVSRPADPIAEGVVAPETFLLYYAGYGMTVQGDQSSEPLRCIIPADFDPERARETCLPIHQIDELLDSRKRSIVIFDTSYDGFSGRSSSEPGEFGAMSRTYRNFLAKDLTWRESAGTDRSDRVFLVASGGNSPALELSDLKHGLFTSSFAESIQEQLSRFTRADNDLSLYDAFAVARNKTASRSAGQEIPIIKGVLSTPFTFSLTTVSNQREEAGSIIARATHDLSAMRAPTLTDLRHAVSLYLKILFFTPSDPQALQGLAAAYLYLGDLDSAETLIRSGVEASLPNSAVRSKWLLLRSKLRLRRGNVASARDDCREARRDAPESVRTAIDLAYLHAALGQYDLARQALEEIMLHHSELAINAEQLEDEEWGKAVLLAYLSFRLTGHPHSASLVLKSYSQSYRHKDTLKQFFVNSPLSRVLLPRHRNAIAMGSKNVDEPWSHLVAEYFGDPLKYHDNISLFRDQTLSLDPKDKDSFDCLLHFYLGMRSVLDGNTVEAKREFKMVMNTHQTDYAEFWIAKNEMDALK